MSTVVSLVRELTRRGKEWSARRTTIVLCIMISSDVVALLNLGIYNIGGPMLSDGDTHNMLAWLLCKLDMYLVHVFSAYRFLVLGSRQTRHI